MIYLSNAYRSVINTHMSSSTDTYEFAEEILIVVCKYYKYSAVRLVIPKCSGVFSREEVILGVKIPPSFLKIK